MLGEHCHSSDSIWDYWYSSVRDERDIAVYAVDVLFVDSASPWGSDHPCQRSSVQETMLKLDRKRNS